MMKVYPVLNANRLGAIELIELGRPRGAFVGSVLPQPQEPFLAQVRREGPVAPAQAAMGAQHDTTTQDVLRVALPVAGLVTLAYLIFG